MPDLYSALLIGICAAVTALLRFIPFLIFGGKRKTPPFINYLGKVLPFAIMGMLVVFCLKGVSVTAYPYGIPEILDAILTVFPLDAYVDTPAVLMDLMERDKGKVATPIWDEYTAIIEKHDERGKNAVGTIDRFDFYEEAKKCYAIIASGEKAIYANIILQKGVI